MTDTYPRLPNRVEQPQPVNYTFWLDYGSEGWQPLDVATLADGFKAMLERGHGGEYRVTRPVQVRFVPA